MLRWLSLLPLCLALHAQVAIAHGDIIDRNLSEERLRDILLGRVTTWASGTPIVIVLIEEAPAIEAQQAITGRDLPQLLRGWKRLVYGGNGAMPLVRRTTAEAVQEVRRRHGAMAIVADLPDLTGLVVLYRDE